MNLLPAVEAYIVERQAQLSKRNPQPIETMRELGSVAILCRGLYQTDESMSALVDSISADKKAEPQPEVWPCRVCGGREWHALFCDLNTRNLTKL